MDKEQLLQELSQKINTGELSRDEVSSRLGIALSTHADAPQFPNQSHFSVTKMLYILGTVIVVLGVIFFTAQIWNDIGSVGRISITLGLGLLCTLLGSMLLKKRPGESIGLVFQTIGGMLIPGGALVTLSELNYNFVSVWPIALTFGAIFLFYLLLNFVHKNAILTFFAIANGTAFIYLLVDAMLPNSFYMHGDIYAYLTMIVGASYIFLAYSFRGGWNSKLISVLYFFGSAGFLGAAFSRVFNSTLWQMFYFLVIIGGFALAVRLKSRSILAMSTVFLLAHVSYITSKYFANSIGWPICLILLGFIFIGLGYVSISISKKYIRNSSV